VGVADKFDVSARPLAPQRLKRRKGKDEIAYRAATKDQNPGVACHFQNFTFGGAFAAGTTDRSATRTTARHRHLLMDQRIVLQFRPAFLT
jgi:hypothetical protein